MHSASLQPGDAVRVRGERWRVTHVTSHETCTVVDAAGVETANAGATARFLLPFELVDHIPRPTDRPLVAGRPAWRHVARAALVSVTPRWRSLRSAVRARITLLPYQLEPALAMNSGLACRMLLADEVGLGKTIQAGLVIAELLARERDARVLIVTPAGLREQWREELGDRFGIEATVIDAARLALAACELPPGVNPWTIPQVSIASIDFLKRGDVIRPLETLVWDLVAFDEAHALAGRSDRATAAELVAARARRVLTITATPHNGDPRAFARLCALGRLGPDDPLLTFRRSRADAGIIGRRSVRMLAIAPTADEARMHRALAAYAARVRREAPRESAPAAGLAMVVLTRRACSSAASLARSLERRIAFLADPSLSVAAQMRLPLGDTLIEDDDERVEHLRARGLGDPQIERRLLVRILSLARSVARESKVAALVRLLRRTREPAIVFTEYRDTLQHLAAALQFEAVLLHGGLSPRDRAAAARVFTRGTVRLLLATDAASEGLNLHHRCRLVVSLDVPWTPLRLEQRIGRVDRLGQSRRVHALTLVARDTSDMGVASDLRARAARADRGAPFGHAESQSLCRDAQAEARRIDAVRALDGGFDSRASSTRPVLTALRRCSRPDLVIALRLTFVDAAGGVAWDTIAAAAIAVRCRVERGARGLREQFDREVGRHALPLAVEAEALHRRMLATLTADLASALEPLRRREQLLSERLGGGNARLAAPLVQPGLFDRRALRDQEAQRRIAGIAEASAAIRRERLARLIDVRAGERRLVFAAIRTR